MVIIYNKTDVESWLNKAKDDILWAKTSLREGFYSQVCFISQQIAEKAFKSLSFSLQKDFTPQEIKILRTHNLNNLIRAIEEKGVRVPREISSVSEELNEFYLPTRYPDIPDPVGSYTEEIAKDALEKAEKVIDFVETQLKK